MSDFRARLRSFYEKHNPTKVDTVDATLEKFKGKEEDMFVALAKKYNVPYSDTNPPSAAPSGGGGGGAANHKERLIKFYQERNPSKLDTVDATLEKFKGREEEMFTALEKKYAAASPASPSSPAASASASGAGGGDNKAASQQPAATGGGMNHKERLIKFYQDRNPSKLDTVDATLEKFKGREEEMFTALEKKYAAASPASPSNQSSSNSSANFESGSNTSSAAGGGGGDYRARLRSFYEKHNAAKIDTVDATLDKFKGREEEMFAQLAKKYNAPISDTQISGGGEGFVPVEKPRAATATPPAVPSSSSSSGTENHRERLIKFYQERNPSKLDTVDATLEKFKGREEEMFTALEKKYAAASPVASPTKPPPPAAEPQQQQGGGEVDYRQRLLSFYEKYNPTKTNTVDATLDKFKGREEEMFAQLAKKYNVDVSETKIADSSSQQQQQQQQQSQQQQQQQPSYRVRLVAMYTKHKPEKLQTVDASLEKFKGREEEMMKALVAKYGEEDSSVIQKVMAKGTPTQQNLPTPPTQQQQQEHQQQQQQPRSYKSRLTAFYKQYAPDRLPKVDDTLSKYSGREEEMFTALVKKYGPEVTPQNSSLQLPPTQQPQQQQQQQQQQEPPSFKVRLTAFYQQYAPERLPKVDDTLHKYSGREEEMFAALTKKYGAEPKITSSPNQQSLQKSPQTQNMQQQQQQQDPTTSTQPSSPSSQQQQQQERKIIVDPVKECIQQQMSMLSQEEAAVLNNVATSQAFLHLVKGVTGTLAGSSSALFLGGAGGQAAFEAHLRALQDEETDARNILDCVEADERGIVSHQCSVSNNKITSSEESEALSKKTNQSLRKLYFEFWIEFAKNQIKQRRREAAAQLSPYQRLAFSKSGMRHFQKNELAACSPVKSPNHNHSPSQQNRSRSAQHQQHQQGSRGVSPAASSNNNNRQLFGFNSSSTLTTPRGGSTGGGVRTASSTMATPRGGSQQNQNSRLAGFGNFATAPAPTPRQGSLYTPRTNLSHHNTSATNKTSSFVKHNRSGADSRMELVKNRHAVETRVEKLTDNQLKSLHRRLEKWGLPIPAFFNNVVDARGIETHPPPPAAAASSSSGSRTPRGGYSAAAASGGRAGGSRDNSRSGSANPNTSAAAGGGGSGDYSLGDSMAQYNQTSAELDAQVMKVLQGMEANEWKTN